MVLKLRMKHHVIEFYKVGIQHVTGLMYRSNMHLNGENKLNVIKWVETRVEHAKVLKIYVYENI